MAFTAPSSDFLKTLVCPVCLEYCAPLTSANLGQEEDIVVLGCGCNSIFHDRCISKVLETQATTPGQQMCCPSCKTPRLPLQITKVGAAILDMIALFPVHTCPQCKAHDQETGEYATLPLYTRAGVLDHLAACPHTPRECPHCSRVRRFLVAKKMVSPDLQCNVPKYMSEDSLVKHLRECPCHPDKFVREFFTDVSDPENIDRVLHDLTEFEQPQAKRSCIA